MRGRVADASTVTPYRRDTPMLDRIELLASTIHDVAASVRCGYGLARIVSDMVRLAFPDCPPETIAHAVRYSDAVRTASTLGTAWGAIPGGNARSRSMRDLMIQAEREAESLRAAFVQSVQRHQFAHGVTLPPADCDPVTGHEYGTGA